MKKVLLITMTVCLCTAVQAEPKTEIIVKKGIVKTATDKGASLVKCGQKAILQQGHKPTVSFNNKIIDKLLQLDRQIQSERNVGTQQINYTSAQVYSINHENTWKIGATMRMPNQIGKATNICRIGSMSILQEVSFYDFEGNLLSYEIEKVKQDEGYYQLKFQKSVEPGQEFKFILITDFKQNIEDFKLLEKKDGHWIVSGRNGTPYCLNYFHVILPESAIFIEAEPQVKVIEEQNGRVTVTIRNYTGKDGDGAFYVTFLWPEKDGTCLDGIPWTNAGQEAVELFERFVSEDIQSPVLWGELAIKLVGGGFYDQAFEAFERCYNGHDSSLWDYTALTWQGHLLDLQHQRPKAIEKYNRALTVKLEGSMRHDQWNIVLDEKWIQSRIEIPFTEDMLFYPELNYRLAYQTDPIEPIIESGLRIGDVYLGMTKDEILEKLGKPRTIFYGDNRYTLDNLPDHYYLLYPDLGIRIRNNIVQEITALTPYYELPNGIKVGDSEHQVIDAFGTNYQFEESRIKDYLEYEHLGLMFEIDKSDRHIMEINMQYPE